MKTPTKVSYDNYYKVKLINMPIINLIKIK